MPPVRRKGSPWVLWRAFTQSTSRACAHFASDRDDGNDKLRALAREFLLDWDVILRQVSEPQLPLTNNAAEQALRHWVIARRISMGTRSEAGTRAFALLASVIETCRKRSAPSWTYIASVIAAARRGLAVPALPSIPAGV